MMVYRSGLCIAVLFGVFVLVVGLSLGGAVMAEEGAKSCAVPGEYGTIQAAVDDAGCGLVKVGRGTFGENVVISRTVRIEGQGAAHTIVDGGGSGEVFTIYAANVVSRPLTLTVTIDGLKIVNGDFGIFNSAAYVNPTGYADSNLYVNIRRCAISGNSSSGIRNMPHSWGRTEVQILDSSVSDNLGWGIANDPDTFGRANLTVVDSVISDNAGGGIANSGCFKHFCTASLYVTGSTISGNSGSGISSGIAADTDVINSTISGNKGEWVAGIVSCETTNLNNSTVSSNSAGIVILNDNAPYGCRGTIAATHSIVANSEDGGDCIRDSEEYAVLTDNGHNIVEDGSCIYAPSSRAGDPLLGPLADNGGKTLTHGLLPGSMAIDAGHKAGCPEKDQRGYSRPADGDLDGTAECDIGAFELRQFLYSFYLSLVVSENNQQPTINN